MSLTANVAITATIVITADDNHPNILPMTASAIITVADRLFIGGGGFAAVTADLGGQRQQLAILRAFGGLPSYNFGELSGDDELFDLASGGDAATVSILVNTWANYTSHQPLVSVSLTVGDSSTPGLSATAAITVSLALPPVVLSLGYAAAGYTAGLSSVTLVSVLASGGADDLQQVLGYTFENVGVLAAGISALSSGGLVLSSTIPATLTATIRVRDNYRDDDDIFVSITLRLTALAADIEIDEAGAPFPHPETGAAFAIVTLTTRGGDGEVTLGVPADADYGIINVSVVQVNNLQSARTLAMTVMADDGAGGGKAAVYLLTVTVLPPLALGIDNGTLTVTTRLTAGQDGDVAASLSVSGGSGEYDYESSEVGALLRQDGATIEWRGVVAGNNTVISVQRHFVVSDRSIPPRKITMTLLTVEYIHPPAVNAILPYTLARAITGVLATAASISVSGGSGLDYAASVIGIGGLANATATVIEAGDTGYVVVEGLQVGSVFLTISVSDNHPNSDDALLSLTLDFAGELAFIGLADSITITTHLDDDGWRLTLSLAGGNDGNDGVYSFSSDILDVLGNDKGAALEASVLIVPSVLLTNARTITIAVEGFDNEIDGLSQSVSSTIALYVVNPPSCVIGFGGFCECGIDRSGDGGEIGLGRLCFLSAAIILALGINELPRCRHRRRYRHIAVNTTIVMPDESADTKPNARQYRQLLPVAADR